MRCGKRKDRMHEVFVLPPLVQGQQYRVEALQSVSVRTGETIWSTYIMCEAWYDVDPDLVSTHGQVWICGNEEVVEQPHVGHGL